MPTTYAIPDGRTVMAATLYTGNSSTQTISNANNGVSFAPDWVWLKVRNDAQSHRVFDTVRGAPNRLVPNGTNAEFAATTELTAFTSTGFTLGSNTDTNGTGFNYVGWQWKAGGTAVTNTAGSITSSVSANTTAGFSVVTYTGNEVAGATVGHGLGVAPSMIIVKRRDGTAVDWAVYHASIGATKYLTLNTNAAEGTSSGYWNDTAPTSSVFSLYNSGATNANPRLFVAYCFAPVAGYSAFGSYTGNASTDGPFVYLGFRPRFIMIKRSSNGTNNWEVRDTARDTYNTADDRLFPNTSDAEDANNEGVDFLSNGFKIRNSGSGCNASGVTYIYACFAENPLKYANAR